MLNGSNGIATSALYSPPARSTRRSRQEEATSNAKTTYCLIECKTSSNRRRTGRSRAVPSEALFLTRAGSTQVPKPWHASAMPAKSTTRWPAYAEKAANECGGRGQASAHEQRRSPGSGRCNGARTARAASACKSRSITEGDREQAAGWVQRNRARGPLAGRLSRESTTFAGEQAAFEWNQSSRK